jgi:superfamily II DNA or RNA helicase
MLVDPEASMKLTKENSNFFLNLQNDNSLYPCTIDLYEDKISVLSEIQYNKCLFHLPTAFGKTVIGCKLASYIKGKVLILIPSDVIFQQWKDQINQDLPNNNITLSMQQSYGNSVKDKTKIEDYKCVIIDECHMNTRLIFEELLPKFKTKYVFGFSATPKLTEFFHQTIKRETKKNFEVNIIRMPFIPKISYIVIEGKKRLNYSGMMKSLIENENRKLYIQDQLNIIFDKHKNEKILILTTNVRTTMKIIQSLNPNFDKKSLSKKVQKILAEEVPVCEFSRKIDYMCDNKKVWDSNCDILIGTYSKIGVGFSSKIFKVLVLLDNRKDIRQNEGRIRIDNVIIYFLVDNHKVFENHLQISLDWIESRSIQKIL